MEGLLQDLPGVIVYLDDVLVTGPNKEEHLKNLDKVMNRLKSAGVTLKQPKCIFLAPAVEYLGHIIDKDVSIEGHYTNPLATSFILFIPM